MSRSPRKLLKRALDPLDEMTALFARYPEARAELADGLGEGGVDALIHAREVIAWAVHRLSHPEVPGSEH